MFLLREPDDILLNTESVLNKLHEKLHCVTGPLAALSLKIPWVKPFG